MSDVHQDRPYIGPESIPLPDSDSGSDSSEEDVDWAQKLKDHIIINDVEGVRYILSEHTDVIEAKFAYHFESAPNETEGATPLILAAGLGHRDIVALLLAKGADIWAKSTSAGYVAFAYAAGYGHIEVIKLFLEKEGPVLIEQRSEYGWTPLMFAAHGGKLSIVKLLIAKGAAIMDRDDDGDTAFLLACSQGHLETIKALVAERSAVVHEKNDDGRTGLMNAAFEGKLDVVEYLLGQSMDTNAKDNRGYSAIHLASYKGHVEIVKLLSDQLNLREITNNFGQTPLLTAAWEGKFAVVKFLLMKGANCNHQDEDGDTALHLTCQNGNLDVVELLVADDRLDVIDIQNTSGQTALHAAIETGSQAIVDILLKKGAKIEIRDKDGWTVLHYAARTGCLAMVQNLLKLKPELLDMRNESGRTALWIAASNGKKAIVNFLLGEEKRADKEDQNEGKSETGRNKQKNRLEEAILNFDDDDLSVVLHYAVGEGLLDIVERILSRFPNLINQPNASGESPLLIAIKTQKQELVELFINHEKADLEVTDDNEDSLLHHAAEAGLLETVKYLVKKRPDLIDRTNKFNETALICAANMKHVDVASFLLDNNADVKALSKYGSTVLHAASSNADPSLVQKIFDAGADPAVSIHGRSALHYASSLGQTRNVDILLKCLLERSMADLIVAHDICDDTPLNDAIINDHPEIVFMFLESSVYLPKFPSEENIYFASPKEQTEVSKWLTAWLSGKTKEQIQKHISAITYWAILNRDQDLFDLIWDKGELPQFSGADSATWAHIAALGNNLGVMKEKLKWPDCILDRTSKNVTPLHLAARQNYHSLVLGLLYSLADVDPLKAIRAIILETEDRDTLLSITATEEYHGNEKHLEDLLWDSLFNEPILSALKRTFSSFNETADRIMEEAAKSYNRGKEQHLQRLFGLLEEMHRRPDGTPFVIGKWSTLQLLVYYKFPLALWCLLSSGDYFGEKHISQCQKMIDKWIEPADEIKKVINNILLIPPPVQPPRTRSLPKDVMEFRNRRRLGNMEDIKGGVLDLFTTNHHEVTFRLKRVELHEIVYGIGPDRIMSEEGYQDYQSLRDCLHPRESARHSPKEARESNDERQKPKEKAQTENKLHPTTDGVNSRNDIPSKTEADKTTRLKKGKDKLDHDIPQLRKTGDPSKRYRWIHIPVNNLAFVVELMNRLSYGKNGRHHHGLPAFVKESWSQLPVGGGTHRMRPHYVSQPFPQPRDKSDIVKADQQSKSTTQGLGRLALYMPYLSWSTTKFLKSEMKSPTSHEPASHSKGRSDDYQQRIVHNPISLDQYFYVSLQDCHLEQRNGDQVLSRFLKDRQPNADDYEVPGNKENSSPNGNEKGGSDTRGIDEAEAPEERVNNIEAGDRDKKDSGASKPEISTRADSMAPTPSQGQSPVLTQIFVVNQLWLWIIDDNTIITSATQDDDQVQETFLHQVLLQVRAQKGISTLSIAHIVEIIVGTATASFHSPNIKIDGTGEGRRSPLEIFRESLQKVRNQEATLFEKFQLSLKEPESSASSNERSTTATESQTQAMLPRRIQASSFAKAQTWWRAWFPSPRRSGGDKSANIDKERKSERSTSRESQQALSQQQIEQKEMQIKAQQISEQGNPHKESFLARWGSWWKSLADNALENRYQNIHNETRLLREVKDILDELQILKDLAKNQEHVNSLWKKEMPADIGINRHFTIDDTKVEIGNMMEEAQSVEGAIKTLLDLKQKQATILEARTTRQQSDTVMVFTVVTIVFLPASFLTSLFALNVTEFPHQGDNVMFEGRLIFPIIFGVSLGISTFFVFLAFNANLFKHILSEGWNQAGTKIHAWARKQPDKGDKADKTDKVDKTDKADKTESKELQEQEDSLMKKSSLRHRFNYRWRQAGDKIDGSQEESMTMPTGQNQPNPRNEHDTK